MFKEKKNELIVLLPQHGKYFGIFPFNLCTSICSYTVVITCRYHLNSDFSLNIRLYFIQFHNFHIDHLNCYKVVYLKMNHNLFRHSPVIYLDCFFNF